MTNVGDERPPPPDAAPMSPLDRVLRIVGDVRGGEGRTALTLGATVFVLLGAYYLLKVAREALLLSSFEAEVKVYVAAAQAALLIPAVSAFGWLSTHVGRVRLVTISTLFFASHLVVFAVLYGMDVEIGIAFYVWVGVFNVFVISQFWTFANDVYTEEQGRRLFAVIGLGSATGAIAGSYGAAPIGDAIGTMGILLVSAALVVSTLLGIRWAHARSKGDDAPASRKPSGRGAFRLLLSDRYLILIAVMMLLLNQVNTIGEYVLDRVMQDELRADVIAAGLEASMSDALEGRVRDFKSEYFFWFNTIALVLQLFVVGRVMAKGGAGLAIVVLPIVALLGQGAMALSGAALLVVTGAKIAENSVDYSLQNTGRNALFLIMPHEVKYRVKPLVDSVLMRVGDMFAGGLVLVGTGVLAIPTLGFVAVNAAVTVVWAGVAIALAREHRRRAEARPGGR
ncbi:MAG: translocase [Myxococcota bacterium]|nr:translocase [Myxococcota bacterium]